MDIFRTTSKICSLARSGLIRHARDMFDKMPHKDTIAWNAMITGYAHLGHTKDALLVFSQMRISDVAPDAFTLTATLSASTNAGDLGVGESLHAFVVCNGLHLSLPVCNALVDMYGKCGSPSSASRVFRWMPVNNDVSWCSLLYAYVRLGDFEVGRRIFDDMPCRGVVAWNMLILAYAQFGEFQSSMSFFKEMGMCGVRGDVWTFSALMTSAAEGEELDFGFVIHAIIVKNGWESSSVVSNSILSFYSKFGSTGAAGRVFESIEIRSQASWNAMMDAHIRIGEVQEAFALFSCAPEKNVVSWTLIITGYARNGNGNEALTFFVEMTKNNVRPDEYTFGPVFLACSNLAVLGHGRMTHGSVISTGFASYVYVGNSLVNMYAKCGDLVSSLKAFDEMPTKDSISWNTMLFSFAIHGCVSDALDAYKSMLSHNFLPDNITFIGLLMACSHSGRLEEAQTLLESMKTIHNLPPGPDHTTCVIDLLGRLGRLHEANQLCSTLEGTSSLVALLSACLAHEQMPSIGRKIGEELVLLEPRKEAGYVMLSNMYCLSGQWEEAEKVRKRMMEHGVKKVPGCSWIEVKDMVFVFVSNTSVPHKEKISEMLSFLHSEMRKPSFC